VRIEWRHSAVTERVLCPGKRVPGGAAGYASVSDNRPPGANLVLANTREGDSSASRPAMAPRQVILALGCWCGLAWEGVR
jgi:hypothetical protein